MKVRVTIRTSARLEIDNFLNEQEHKLLGEFIQQLAATQLSIIANAHPNCKLPNGAVGNCELRFDKIEEEPG